MRLKSPTTRVEGRKQESAGGGAGAAQPSTFDLRPIAAFTLIEIMIVVGMIAIIMAWGLPSFVHTLRKSPMRQAVSDIMEGLSHARARAILNGTPAEFVIRAEGGQLSVQQAAGSAGGTAQGGASQGGPSQFNARLDDDIAVELLDVNFHDHMQADEARVRFFPNGTSDEFTIVIRSPEGEWRKISLELTTGLASVEVIK